MSEADGSADHVGSPSATTGADEDEQVAFVADEVIADAEFAQTSEPDLAVDQQAVDAALAAESGISDPRVISAVERAADAADAPVAERTDVFRDVLGRLNSALADEDGH